MTFELAKLRKRIEVLEQRQERAEAFLRKLEQRAFPILTVRRCERCHGIGHACEVCSGAGVRLLEDA